MIGLATALALFQKTTVPPVAPRKPASTAPPELAQSQRILPFESGDDLAAVLQRAGATSSDAEAVDRAANAYLPRAGSSRLELTFSGVNSRASRLQSVIIAGPDGSGVALSLSYGRYQAVPLVGHVETVMRVLRGEMDGDSFYTSAVAAGFDDRLVPEIAAALSFDFDFQREIHKGDVFEIAVTETINARGELVGRERLVFVKLVTETKSCALYRFAAAQGGGEWFDGDGRSIRRSLMRTPVEGARISSNFGMRMHPILGFMRMHKGIDFATPVGTPVFASGDGVITAEGQRSGYGLYLRIDHTGALATAYAHLSGFANALTIGSHVNQGQIVAFTGDTGELSTGPHLHYEVLINGQQVNPLTVSVGEGEALTGEDLIRFRSVRDQVDLQRQKGE